MLINDLLRAVLLILVLVLVLAVTGLDYELWRAWRFQQRRLGLQIDLKTWFRRLWRRRTRYRASLTDIRDLVVNLQLAVSLNEPLSAGLIVSARQLAGRGIFGERLKKQVDALVALDPEGVIKRLAEDFDSDELREVVRGLEAVKGGGVTNLEALTGAVKMIEAEIQAQIQRDIQAAPVRLTVPMVAGVFFPALLLGIIPLVVNLLRQLGGR